MNFKVAASLVLTTLPVSYTHLDVYKRQPYYNIEGYGIKFVASPRHADLLLVTGPVSRHMAFALQRTYEATPEPKLVVAVGDCGCDGGIFGENYASLGGVAKVIPVDYVVHGLSLIHI